MTTRTKLHVEHHTDQRPIIVRILNRIRHQHHAALTTWTLNDTPWNDDPDFLVQCKCGATRHPFALDEGWQTP